MNSSSRSLIAIALGIGFGLVALTILSGGYTHPTSTDQSIRVGIGLASAPRVMQNQTFAATNNLNPQVVNTGNPLSYPFTVLLLVAISLAVAMGASLGISRKINSYKNNQN